MASAQTPLGPQDQHAPEMPREGLLEAPLMVNSRQFHAILRRRHKKQKIEGELRRQNAAKTAARLAGSDTGKSPTFSDTSYVPIASSDSSFDLLNYSESELSFDLDEDDSVMASRGAVLGKRARGDPQAAFRPSPQMAVLSTRTQRNAAGPKESMYSVGPSDKASRSKGFQPKAVTEVVLVASAVEPSAETVDSVDTMDTAGASAEALPSTVKNGIPEAVSDISDIPQVKVEATEDVVTKAPSRVSESPQASVKVEDTDEKVVPTVSTPLQPIKPGGTLVKVVNNDPPVPPSRVRMRITNDTPESELPNGAEIHVIDRERVIIIPSHLDPRTIPSQSARSQVQGGPSTLSAVPTAPVPRPGHQKAFVYRQSNILREVGPDPTGIKAQVAKAQAEAMAEFGQRELRGKGRTAASPEDLEMARRIVDTGEHSSGEGASAKKVRTVIEVESMEKAFPYLHLITEGEPNADVAAPEPEKGKSKSSGFKDPIALQQGNATASSSKWVKDRDIKPVNDHNETGSNAWGSDVPEGFARHSFSSDQEPWKDEDNEVEGDVRHQLADWSGNMAPAPVEWDSRSAYNNQSPQHAKSIDKWVAENGWNKAGEVVDTSDPRFLDSRPGHESALTFVVDGATLQEPEKLEPTKRDMDDKLTLEHANERAETLVENWVANKNKLITDEEELRNFQRAMYWKVHNEYVPGPNPHAPKANIYLRPATALDVEQIGIIMNYYVLSSCSRIETKEFSAEALGSSIAMSTEVDGLPYIVAVLRIPPKDKKQREKQQIVGVAYANHLGNDQSDAYRYTVEFNLFVHPQHKRQGVGKSLMDMMIHVLDPYYLPRQGYVFQYDKETEHRYVAGGGKWGLKKICVLMPFDADDTAEYETVKKWLEKEWEFEEEAILKHHGYKFKMPSKVLNVGYLVRFTKHHFNMQSVP